jgi:HD-GYP domain-containing protein (c-di-GMP phosphodiesterase class II)
VRLRPYLTVRILRRVAGLERVAQLAGNHHERVDGSGNPRWLVPRWVSPTASWPPR